MGGGIQKGIDELTSERARESSAKIVILLPDGKPNVNSSNSHFGSNAGSAVSCSQDSADEAGELGTTVCAIGVEQDVNEDLLRLVADHQVDDNTPNPDNNGLPTHVTQLEGIFMALGGRRPVRQID